jgi:hypothetical protein
MKHILILLLVLSCSKERRIRDNSVILGDGASPEVTLEFDTSDTLNEKISHDGTQWNITANAGIPYRLEGVKTTTKGDILAHDGTQTQRLPVGANGQVLSSNSSSSTGLQWIDDVYTKTFWEFNSVNTFTSTGSNTWNRPVGTTRVIFIYCGAGGAGRGTAASNAGEIASGAGGTGGQGRICIINNPAASIAISIGTGGTGASNANGTAGGQTTITGCSSGAGGTGGTAVITTGTTVLNAANIVNSSVVQTSAASAGPTNISLARVSSSTATRLSGTVGASGSGGYPVFPFASSESIGTIVTARDTQGDGIAGGFCQGGGGGFSTNGGAATAGGNGGNGYVIALNYTL